MPSIISRIQWLIVASLMVLAGACTPGKQEPSPTGAAQFVVTTSKALSASGVTRVKVTLSAADIPPTSIELDQTSGEWTGTLSNIRAGTDRTFTAEAFNAEGIKRFQGEASGITITAGQTSTVVIILQELNPAPPYTNEAPYIESLVASGNRVGPGGTISLRVTAKDPNPGDTLTYLWTATAGSFSNASDPTSAWTAPAAQGSQTLTFTVSDQLGTSATISLTINVQVTGDGSATIKVQVNSWPVVKKMTAAPTSVAVGQATTVEATVEDSDGDTLSYQWSANCAGTWTNETARTAQFTPTAVPDKTTCSNCQLTITVKDGRQGQMTGTLGICVGREPTVRLLPQFNSSYQSAQTVRAGETVRLKVSASDPQGTPLSFTWDARKGSLAGQTDDNGTSEIRWTAPSCMPAEVAPTVTVTATSADQLSSSSTFNFTWNGETCPEAGTKPQIDTTYQQAMAVSPGSTVRLRVGAHDPQGSQLSFKWTSNVGALLDETGSTGTSGIMWTAPSCLHAGLTPTVTLAVTNASQQSETATFTFTWSGASCPTGSTEPVIDSTYQQMKEVAPGSIARLRVSAHDPYGTQLKFAWKTSVGILSTATTSQGTSELTWKAPSWCLPSNDVVSVTVTTTNANQQSKTTTFTFTWKGASCPASCPSVADYLGKWSFDDTYEDWSAGNRHLQPQGTQVFVPGVWDKAVRSDPSPAPFIAQRPSADSVFAFGNTNFTVMAWVKVDSATDSYIVSSTSTNGCSDGWALFAKNGSVCWNMRTEAGCYDDCSSSSVLPINKWTHVALVRNGATFQFYVDGLPKGTNTRNVGIYSSGYPLKIGASGPNYSGRMYGTVDDVAILKRAAAASEIAEIASKSCQ